jgi:nitronate monooxygenase
MMAKHTGSTSWTKNRLTSRLGVQYPIIQGPLGGLSSQRLTAAVSNYGGLGSFGAHGLKPEAILSYLLQRALVRRLSIPAERAGMPELPPLSWAGQSANLSRISNVSTLLDTLVREISEIGGAVQSWSARRRHISEEV